jgi:hypothetical protein
MIATDQESNLIPLMRNSKPVVLPQLVIEPPPSADTQLLLDLSQRVEVLETTFSQLEELIQPLIDNNWAMHRLNNAINDVERRIRMLEQRNSEILKLDRNVFRRR